MIESKIPESPETWGVIGAVLGAIISKVTGILVRGKFSEANSIRKELRVEVQRLSEEIKKMHDELDSWRDRYYKLTEEHIHLKAECKSLRLELGLPLQKQELKIEAP